MKHFHFIVLTDSLLMFEIQDLDLTLTVDFQTHNTETVFAHVS